MGMQNVRSSSMKMFHHSVKRVILSVSCSGANAKNVIVPLSPSAKSTLGSSTPRRSPTNNAPAAACAQEWPKGENWRQITQNVPTATHAKHYANHVQCARTNATRPATTVCVQVPGTLMPKRGDSEVVAEVPTTIRTIIDVSLKIT